MPFFRRHPLSFPQHARFASWRKLQVDESGRGGWIYLFVVDLFVTPVFVSRGFLLLATSNFIANLVLTV